MPNLAEWFIGGVFGNNQEPWEPYSDDPAEAYQQFHERLRQSENTIVQDGKPADGRRLLGTIRMLHETRHDFVIDESEQPGTRSYRSP